MALGHDLHSRSSTKEFRARLFAAIWLVGVAILLLLSRLYALQILRGEELSSKGRRNFVNQVQVPHDRGIIYDRWGRILVDNRPSLDLQVTPAFLGKRPAARETLRQLGALLKLNEDELQRVQDQVESRTGLERFRPVVVRRDLDPEQVEAIEGERSLFMLDGVDIVEGRRRTYHYGALAAHVLGYVNEIDAGALDAERQRGNPDHYDLGDFIGREGVERTYERELRGVDGIEKVVVDAKGRRQQASYVDALLGEHRRVDPTPGHNVFLTLDLDLQQRAEEAFLERGRAGSVVALDPRTGAVLVLASLPAYDSNLVSGSLAKDVKERYDNDPLKPWINRSIAGQYAPGSTFKVATGLAALRERATSGHERILCPGYYKMGRHVWRCHKDSGHGMVDLHDAMKASCDVYFYTMAGRIGINPIAAVSRLLSFGTRTGIALRGEQPGNVPDEAFHNRVDAATGGYQRGMAINTAIGQGSLLVTPLQLATAYAAVANGRAAFTPQLVDRIETADFRVTRRFLPQAKFLNDAAIGPDGVPVLLSRDPAALTPPVQSEVRGDGPTRVSSFEPKATAELNMPPEHLAQVRSALNAVAQEPGGTAYYNRSRKVSMGAKTGTAQVIRLGRERLKEWQIDYFERDHAWFVGYAPAEDPEIVVAVINEHAGHGGSASEPIAVQVIDAYFEMKATRLARAPQGG
ncbi:MAG TPA: penicillin-binding protein 2, partial [Myxococcota bacterium]|nr:penicillin-binding protein 2 [Myxococcota bacterium]